MGVLVYILGRSGTGKSFSMYNFNENEIAVINVQGKPLPFRNDIMMFQTDQSDEIVDLITNLSKKYKSIVVDDYQYIMSNEFMRRSYEKGYDKFIDIAKHAWDVADIVRKLPKDVIVYIISHSDFDANGVERLKTLGKLLDEKIYLEGMSVIVLKSNVCDSVYTFLTQNNGNDTTKSPSGMFPSYAIDNDLKYVDQKIRAYYNLSEHLSDEDLEKLDEKVRHDEIKKEEKNERKSRRRDKEKNEDKFSKAPEKKEEKSREDIKKENSERVTNAGIFESADNDEVPFDEVEAPELEPLPRRKRRRDNDVAEDQKENDTVSQQEISNEERTTRRRRRI